MPKLGFNRGLVSVLLIAAVLLSALAIPLATPEPVSADPGWLEGYFYRQEVAIEGSTDGTQYNYTMRLTLADSTSSYGVDETYQGFLDSMPFVRHPGNPIIAHVPGTWESGSCGDPFIVQDKDDSTKLIMFYNSGPIGVIKAMPGVAFADADNPYVWTKYEGNPVMTCGPAGSWDEQLAIMTSVVVYNDQYWLYYWGDKPGTSVPGVGLAISDDGIHFTKYEGNPIFRDGSWTERGDVWKEGDTWYMIYTAEHFGNFKGATSTDGIHWTIQGVAYDPGTCEGHIEAKIGNTYALIYETTTTPSGTCLRMATSSTPLGPYTAYGGGACIFSPSGVAGTWDAYHVATAGIWYDDTNRRWMFLYQGSGEYGVPYLTPWDLGVAYTDTSSGSIQGLNSHCEDFPVDIRFTASDGDTELDYWQEENTNTTDEASFWVEIPAIPTSGTSIYVYYGKEGDSSASDSGIFSFFDTFDEGSLNETKWSLRNAPVVTLADGVATIVSNATAEAIRSTTTATYSAMLARLKFPDYVSETSRMGIMGWRDATPTNQAIFAESDGTQGATKIYVGSQKAGDWSFGSLCTVDDHTDYQVWEVIRKNASSILFNQNYSLGTEKTTDVPTAAMSIEYGADGGGGACTIYADWMLIHDYIYPEPAFGDWGDEETSLPTVAALLPVGVTTTGATLRGNLIDIGGASVTNITWEWGNETGVYNLGSYSETGTISTGTHSHPITGLSASTTYYWRFDAYNSYGWANTTEQSFATPSVGVVTGSVANQAATSATLQGELTDIGAYSTVYAYFDYGQSTSYGTSTTEKDMTSAGGFNADISGLTLMATYHYRAVVRYSATGRVYGDDRTFTASAMGAPTVSTGEVPDEGETTATLQGTLTSLGDYSPVYTSFQYGLTTSYGSTTVEETKTSPTGFNAAISGLSEGTTYHFRARARYAATSYVYGNDGTFATTGGVLSPPSNFLATRGDTTIALSWTKASGAINTLIRRATDAHPTTVTSGTQVYFGTGTGVTDTGRDNAQGYYYSAWSEVSGTYSSLRATAYSAPAGTGEGILPPPDSISICNIKVFENYLSAGDQLICFEYRLDYVSGDPSQDVSDFFAFELYSGSTLIARQPAMAWGHKPGSIYLSAGNAMTWGGSGYTVKIRGVPSQWADIPERAITISSWAWQTDRASLDELRQWVLTIANIIDPDWIAWIDGEVLSDAGCSVFRQAIPSLTTQMPGICSTTTGYLQPDDTSHDPTYQRSLTREAALGNYTNNLIDAAADVFGMEGNSFGTMLMVIMAVVLGVGVGMLTHNGALAIGSAIIPTLIAGGIFGLIPLAAIMIIGALTALFFFWHIWIRGV